MEKELDSNRHFYLYAKGHYKETDTIKDLSIILGEYCFQDLEYIRVSDILDKLLRLAYREFIKNSNEFKFMEFMKDILPQNNWKFMNDKAQNLEETMIHKCLSVLRFAIVTDKDKNVILNLGEADSSILPLSDFTKLRIINE